MKSVSCPSCGNVTLVLTQALNSTVVCLRCRVPVPAKLLGVPESRPGGHESATDDSTPACHPVQVHIGTPGGSTSGMVVALVFGLLGAVVLGFVTAGIRESFWVVLVFAAAFGAGLGSIVGVGAWVGKYRFRRKLAAVGALTGLIGSFLIHYFGYRIAIHATPELNGFNFWKYLARQCEAGIGIWEFNLGYAGTAIYWIIEVFVVVFFAAVVSTWPSKRPFCAECNTWKRWRPLGPFGSTARLRCKRLLRDSRLRWWFQRMTTGCQF